MAGAAAGAGVVGRAGGSAEVWVSLRENSEV